MNRLNGRTGNNIGGNTMPYHFEYVSKNSKVVKSAYQNLIEIIKQTQNELRDNYSFQFRVVGSYSRNMMTYDSKSNKGFDFDVNIYPNIDENKLSPQKIKESLILAINKYAKSFGYSPAENSTRVITIKVKDTENSKIKHSVDFAIVNDYVDEDGYDCQEYIRFNKKSNQYEWLEQDDGFYKLDDKIDWIKDEDLWDELRRMYLFRKNNNNDKNKHSRSLFAEAVNNICNEYGYYD